MMTCVELAFRFCIEYHLSPEKDPESVPPELATEVEKFIEIAFEMLPKVQEVMGGKEATFLLNRVHTEDAVEKLFTTVNGILSINQFLAMLTLPEAAMLPQHEKWPRICFGLLAEAVMRNCRARVRSGKYSAEQLIDRALLIGSGTRASLYNRNIKMSSRTTNAFMSQSYTNCSPFKTVGVLYFVKYLHEGKSAKDIASSYLHGKASMATFLHNYLPGFGGYITQLALYLQGLTAMKGRDRQYIQFGDPKKIVNDILEERLQFHKIQRLRKQEMKDKVEKRRLVRQAEAEPFRKYHTRPSLFKPAEVDSLNMNRTPDDQLELMKNGLLKHHCCFPDCPDYLRNFQTPKDKQHGQRFGLMNHLRHDQELGTYVKSWHVDCEKNISMGISKDRFVSVMSSLHPMSKQRLDNIP